MIIFFIQNPQVQESGRKSRSSTNSPSNQSPKPPFESSITHSSFSSQEPSRSSSDTRSKSCSQNSSPERHSRNSSKSHSKKSPSKFSAESSSKIKPLKIRTSKSTTSKATSKRPAMSSPRTKNNAPDLAFDRKSTASNGLPMPGLSGTANVLLGNLLKGPVDEAGKLKNAALMVGVKLDLEADVHLTARIRGDILLGLY